jgi:glycosyltransferase involved in cell wall biosynthesis
MQQIFTYILSIRRQLQDDLPDAVFCNDMRGLLTVGVAAKTLGLPVVIWDKLDKPHGWLDWFQLPLVTKNLIISSSVQVKYPIWQRKFFHNKIEKIFNGVDLMRFETSNCHPIRESLPGSYNDVLLAIVGSINARKGHDRIFSIWPKLLEVCPNLRLLVVGEASSAEDQQYLDGLPNKDNERVHFLGMRADVPNLMCSIDILLMPSRYEGMGQVSVEAMAAKVPVIGANAGGIPEVVLNDVTGLIVNADNPEEWVAAISRLASSSELRNQMGLAGSSRVEAEFNRPVQMAKVLKHCLDAIPSNQL